MRASRETAMPPIRTARGEMPIGAGSRPSPRCMESADMDRLLRVRSMIGGGAPSSAPPGTLCDRRGRSGPGIANVCGAAVRTREPVADVGRLPQTSAAQAILGGQGGLDFTLIELLAFPYCRVCQGCVGTVNGNGNFRCTAMCRRIGPGLPDGGGAPPFSKKVALPQSTYWIQVSRASRPA